MALSLFTCIHCEFQLRTFSKTPTHCGHPMDRKLEAPAAKMQECVDEDRRKSRTVGLTETLKARAKDYKRDHEISDYIDSNRRELAKGYGWLNSNGLKRRKIDDL